MTGSSDAVRSGPAGSPANMRRQLTAPASAIAAFADMLRREVVDNDGLQEVAAELDRIFAAAQSLKEQVDNLASHDRLTNLGVESESAFRKLRHDLRTPINAIKGYGEMLREDLAELRAEYLGEDLDALLEHSGDFLKRLDALTPSSLAAQVEGHGVDEAPRLTSVMQAELAQSMRIGVDDGPPPTLSGNILAVDDYEANRELLAQRLRRDGHHVVTAEGGIHALKLMSDEVFDLVLLDLMMPDMNGFEVLARIKADPSLRHIPVIMISALDEIDSVVRCIEAGADDYLPKPFDPVLLNARINAALERMRWREREQLYLERLEVEKEKHENLLLNILPRPIVDRLNSGEAMIADRYCDVSVLFSDLVGFTEFSARHKPDFVVRHLNNVFSLFDRAASELGVEKIKMIGDAYMVVSGMPESRDDHAEVLVEMAMRMISAVERLNAETEQGLQVRIGIHSGPVVAGIIGTHRFLYDVWGDTVNVANRMETLSGPGRIHISEDTAKQVRHRFALAGPMSTQVKGKGEMKTYFVEKSRTDVT